MHLVLPIAYADIVTIYMPYIYLYFKNCDHSSDLVCYLIKLTPFAFKVAHYLPNSFFHRFSGHNLR